MFEHGVSQDVFREHIGRVLGTRDFREFKIALAEAILDPQVCGV